jgi:hypothetical protein
MAQGPMNSEHLQALMEMVRQWMAQSDDRAGEQVGMADGGMAYPGRYYRAYGGGFGSYGGAGYQPQVRQAQQPTMQTQVMPPQQQSSLPPLNYAAPTQGIADFRAAQGLDPVSLPSLNGLGSGIDPAMMAAGQAQMRQASPVAQAVEQGAPAKQGFTIFDLANALGGSMGGGDAPLFRGSGSKGSQPMNTGGTINSINSAIRLARQQR